MGVISTKAQLRKITLQPDRKPKTSNGKSNLGIRDSKSIANLLDNHGMKHYRNCFSIYHVGDRVYLQSHASKAQHIKRFVVFCGVMKSGSFALDVGFSPKLGAIAEYFATSEQAMLNKLRNHAKKYG